jgi:hypothetical protein
VPRLTPQEQLKALRKYRNPKRRDLSIAADVEALRKAAVRQAGALGGLDEQWGGLVPGELAVLSRPVRLTPGGVLHIACTDSAACFELDQWQRAGGLALLRSNCTATLKGVRITVQKAAKK